MRDDLSKIRRPELAMYEILSGLRDDERFAPVLMRATVVAVDMDGGLLQNPDGDGSVANEVDGKRFSYRALVGPKNPPRSLKARVLTNDLDMFRSDDDLRVFWPLLPDVHPVKPGEHVYVTFEDEFLTHGLWLTRVAGHVDQNIDVGEERYSAGEMRLPQAFGSPAVAPQKKPTERSATVFRSSGRLSSQFR